MVPTGSRTVVPQPILDGDDLRFVAATSDMGAEAERRQESNQSGPCLESIRQDQPVAVTDLGACHDRWPTYAPAVEEIGFHAVLGIPLVLDDRRVGSLDVYSAEPRPWDDEAVDAARVLTDVGAAPEHEGRRRLPARDRHRLRAGLSRSGVLRRHPQERRIRSSPDAGSPRPSVLLVAT